MGIDRVIDGVLRFQREVFPQEEEWYRELALSQKPAALFIGCSDSRVVPEVLTQQSPGSLFVVRNAGNIVPPYGPEPGGVTASIEYAVSVLEVPDIVICGHTGCGAMTAIQSGNEVLEKLPAVARWLHYADAARDAVSAEMSQASAEDYLEALVHENVLAQLANLLTHPTVRKAVEAKKIRVHGWVYNMQGGGVEVYDAAVARFVPVVAAAAAVR